MYTLGSLGLGTSAHIHLGTMHKRMHNDQCERRWSKLSCVTISSTRASM